MVVPNQVGRQHNGWNRDRKQKANTPKGNGQCFEKMLMMRNAVYFLSEGSRRLRCLRSRLVNAKAQWLNSLARCCQSRRDFELPRRSHIGSV